MISFLQARLMRYAPMVTVAVACFVCSWPSAWAAPSLALEEAERRIQERQAEQRQLLDQLRQELRSLPPLSGVPSNDPEQARHEAHRRQLLTLLAEIERRIAEDGQNRIRFVSSSSKDIALHYYSMLRHRIEEAGTKSFPKDGNQSLYGKAVLRFTVSASGTVGKIKVLRADSKKIAAHSVSLLQRLAPFEPFPEELASKVDQLVISAPFNYRRLDHDSPPGP